MKYFHSNRTTRGHIDEVDVDMFNTNGGLLQGSVIAHILFNVYIKDMFRDTISSRCKFADDDTLWSTGSDVKDMQIPICDDMEEIREWCNK